jgi:hypothetical protein
MSEQLSLSSMVSKLEEDKNRYMKRVQKLKTELDSKNHTIEKLNIFLDMERFKNNLYKKIIENYTTIKLENIYQEKDNEIHIYNEEKGNIPVIIHEITGEYKEYSISNKTKTKKCFRSVNNIELTDEKPKEQEEKLKKVEEEIEEIVKENKFDVSVKDISNNIEKMFDEVCSNRIIKKNLISIKDERVKLLGRLKLPEYIKLIETHITRLEDIFKNKKSHDHKKTTTLISSSLSSLEQRLVFYGQYYNTYLEADDIQRFKAALQVTTEHPTRYIPFLFSELCNKLHNYSIAICSINELLTRVLVNPVKEFNNIVYLPVEKSSKEDPYSFYILENVLSDGKRNWKLECRLDEFSKSLSHDLKSYCIDLFRKIYFNIFNDNIFRENYTSKAPINEQDCIQILENIIILSNQKTFCNMLRKLIVENCTIKPSVLDKFNFTADDKIIKRTFAQEQDEPEEVESSIKRIFDCINKNDIQNVISIIGSQ